MLRLLGPVEVSGRAGTPRERLVLAALAVEVGRAVPVAVLADRVWGGDAPAHGRRTLHAYVSRAKRLVAGTIEGTGGGYVLRLDPHRVDLHLFRSLVERAREVGCPPERQVALLREAAGLWRGRPLAGLDGAWCARMRELWLRERLAATVAWADAELTAGDPGSVVGSLTELSADYPLDESLAAALMRVLGRLGRTAEAAAWFARVRSGLLDELGVDPGPRLLAAHAEVASARTARRVAAQLPAALAVFAGRVAELDALDRAVASVVVVSGTAGVGKTALAVHWAHRVADRFPDGQLYANLRGFDPSGTPVDPADAVRGLLEGLKVPAGRIPPDLDARVSLYRSRLAGRRMLVVLDNARDPDQVRPLLSESPGCLTLVTSRTTPSGADHLTLGRMPVGEAVELLTRRLDPQRVAAEPRAVHDIVGACARLPLALSIAAAHAAAHPDVPLAETADRLRAAPSTLDVLSGGDPVTDLREVFSWSYRSLSAGAARLFRLLGRHPGPDLGVDEAASIAGVPVDRLLAELAQAHLVEAEGERYTLHGLLRAYAKSIDGG